MIGKISDENSMRRIVTNGIIPAIDNVLKSEGTVDTKICGITNLVNAYNDFCSKSRHINPTGAEESDKGMKDIVAIEHAIKQNQLKACVRDDKICLKNVLNERVEIGNIEYAHWIADDEADENGNQHYHCSKCGRVDFKSVSQEVRYCWWCGRRMDNG